MNIAAIIPARAIESGAQPAPEPIEEITPTDSGPANRDSLSEIVNDELEAWARHALGANGFGDYP